MPIATELTIRMDNRPGSLGKICRELADREVNILAFQSIPSARTILVCIVVDKPAAAEAIFDAEGISYTETEVAQVQLRNAPGELAGLYANEFARLVQEALTDHGPATAG